MRIAVRAACVALLMAFPTAAVAQSITVPPPSLTAGNTVSIDVMDPGKANQVVTVTVDNGSHRNPEVEQIEVQLDANGIGSASWVPPDSPNWWAAIFRMPGANHVARAIMPRPDPEEQDPEEEQPVAIE